MKKIYYLLLALVASSMVACNNEDIVVETSDYTQKYDLVCDINIENMYKEFSISKSITDLVRSGKYELAFEVFAYDAEGSLAAHESIHKADMNSLTVEMPQLNEGEYTIIAVETLDYKTENKTESGYYAWHFNSIDRLSTLTIEPRFIQSFWHQALGIVTTTVNLHSNASIELAPKAIGSFVNTAYYGYDKSQFVSVGIGGYDMCEGYRPNPNLSLPNRYIYSLTETKTFTLLDSEDVDGNDEVSLGTIYFIANEVHLTCPRKTQEQVGTTSWKIWDLDVKMQDGEWYDMACVFINGKEYRKFGSSEDVDEWVETMLNTIPGDQPTDFSIYFKPCTDFGCSETAVKNYMKNFPMSIIIDMDYSSTIGGYQLSYSTASSDLVCLYRFDNAKTMDSVVKYFYSAKYSEVTAVYDKEYTFVGEDKTTDGSNITYRVYSDNSSVLVGVYDNTQNTSLPFVMAIYLNGSPSRSSQPAFYDISKMLESSPINIRSNFSADPQSQGLRSNMIAE